MSELELDLGDFVLFEEDEEENKHSKNKKPKVESRSNSTTKNQSKENKNKDNEDDKNKKKNSIHDANRIDLSLEKPLPAIRTTIKRNEEPPSNETPGFKKPRISSIVNKNRTKNNKNEDAKKKNQYKMDDFIVIREPVIKQIPWYTSHVKKFPSEKTNKKQKTKSDEDEEEKATKKSKIGVAPVVLYKGFTDQKQQPNGEGWVFLKEDEENIWTHGTWIHGELHGQAWTFDTPEDMDFYKGEFKQGEKDGYGFCKGHFKVEIPPPSQGRGSNNNNNDKNDSRVSTYSSEANDRKLGGNDNKNPKKTARKKYYTVLNCFYGHFINDRETGVGYNHVCVKGMYAWQSEIASRFLLSYGDPKEVSRAALIESRLRNEVSTENKDTAINSAEEIEGDIPINVFFSRNNDLQLGSFDRFNQFKEGYRVYLVLARNHVPINQKNKKKEREKREFHARFDFSLFEKNQLRVDPQASFPIRDQFIQPGFTWETSYYESGECVKSSIRYPKPLVKSVGSLSSTEKDSTVVSSSSSSSSSSEKSSKTTTTNKGKIKNTTLPAIKPISALFQGIVSRSLLESKWIVFLMSMRFVFFYEPITWTLEYNGETSKYTPDFLILGTIDQEKEILELLREIKHPGVKELHDEPNKNPVIDGVQAGSNLGSSHRLMQEKKKERIERDNPNEYLKNLQLDKLPKIKPFWIEVKPMSPTQEERLKMSLLVKNSGIDGYIFYGQTFAAPHEQKYVDGISAVIFPANNPTKSEEPMAFAECPSCKKIDITFHGSEFAIDCPCKKNDMVTSKYFSKLLASYSLASGCKAIYNT